METKVRRVFVSAGHSNVKTKDRGAIGLSGIVEGDLTVVLRRLVVDELKLLGVYTSIDPDSYVTKDTVAIINSLLDSRDIAIDLHFNWSEFPTSRGTEVIIPFKYSSFEKELGTILSREIALVLGTKDRGAKTEASSFRKHLMFMTPDCENLLIEVCFISNNFDLAIYLCKEKVVAKVIAKCIYDFLTK
jgi:N-acetylmuramoyl-L-alanine amidase